MSRNRLFQLDRYPILLNPVLIASDTIRLSNPTSTANRAFLLIAVLLGMVCSSGGCNSFGNNRLVKELQSENERLLAEFRAQRDRNEKLEQANRVQAERLAESEKLLARITQSSGAGRVSSLSPTFSQSGSANPSSSPINHSPAAGLPSADTLQTNSPLQWHPRIGPAR